MFPQQKKRNEPHLLVEEDCLVALQLLALQSARECHPGSASVSRILRRTIVGGEYYEPHLIRCQVLFSCVQGDIAMHSLCMNAADDESVQPIKILLVVALPVPLVIEMSACLLHLAYRLWHWENTWSVPEGTRSHWEALSASLPS